MPAITRTSVVGQIYSGASGSTLTLTSDATPKAGDIAIVVASATGYFAKGHPTTIWVSTAGWSVRAATADDNGPATLVAARELNTDGAVSVSIVDNVDSAIHAALIVVAGTTVAGVSATFDLTRRAGTANATTAATTVSSPAVTNVPIGALPITWHPSYFLSGGTSTAWTTTLPSGRSTWQPTTIADTSVSGLATYPVTTSVATFAARSATLNAARKSLGTTIIAASSSGPNVEHVATTAAGGGAASSAIWCAKPLGSALDDDASTFRFSGQSTARQRVIIQRFRNCHPTAPILTGPTWGANTTTAATAHVAPTVAWSPRSMMSMVWTTYNGPGVWNAFTPSTPSTGRSVPDGNVTAQEMLSATELSNGTSLSSGTRTATYNVSSVWNAASLVLRAADTVATGVEVLVAWHSMDASQSSSTMDTYAWGGWTLLGTLTRVSSAGAANFKVYYQIVPSFLSDPVWSADTDLQIGDNEATNPACHVDATGWAARNTAHVGGRATDLVNMMRPTGYRVTKGSDGNDVGMYAGAAISVTPGATVTISAEMESSVDVSRGILYAAYFDSGGAAVSSLAGTGGENELFSYVPVRITSTTTVPASAATMRVMPYIANCPLNTILEATAVRIQRGVSISWQPYVDGDMFRCFWLGTRGASASRRDATKFPDASAVTIGTGVGYYSTQRQDGNGANVSSPAALPVEAAAFGRPGRQVRADMPSPPYQRVEHNPEHRQFISGDDFFFSFAFALPAGWPTWVTDYWVIEQLHAAPDTGSPVVSFECRDYSLRMRGGDNKPNPQGGTFGTTYGYNIPMLQNLRVNRWYSVIYRVLFSDQEGGGAVDVWVDGERKLSGYGVPGATVYPGGPTYRKQGAYKRSAIEAGEVYHAGSALGRSYGAVNPVRPQLVATSDFAPAEFF